MLMISAKEISQLLRGIFKNLDPGQIDNPEMVWLLPVEPSAVDDENLFLLEQIQGKFFIVRDVKLLDIYFGENVKCRLGLHCCDARDISESPVNVLSLLINSPSGTNLAVHALVAAMGGLN